MADSQSCGEGGTFSEVGTWEEGQLQDPPDGHSEQSC